MSTESRKKLVYDPLAVFMEHYASEKTAAKEAVDTSSMTIEEKLKHRIVDGDSIGLEEDLDKAREKYEPLEIINTILLDGMKVVGDLFGAGEMQLPFVLQSAETMKASVAHLEQFMEKEEGSEKGVIILATVKGDVHDIGKNLVDIILTNNGYKVVNLGIKVPIETMLSAAKEHRADAIGMSGLLVKSTLIMKENLELMKKRGIDLPVVLGGAALNKRFVNNDLQQLYGGKVVYAKDAFSGLSFMDELAERKKNGSADTVEADDEEISDTAETVQAEQTAEESEKTGGASLESSSDIRNAQEKQADNARTVKRNKPGQPPYSVRSDVATDVPVPEAPFYGSKLVPDVPIDKVFEYINDIALIRGQWQIRRSKMKKEDYERLLEEEIYPKFDELKLKVKREELFKPAVVYGYFPCSANGDQLVVYKPKGLEGDALYEQWDAKSYGFDDLEEWQSFNFPRQKGDRHLCISDYFKQHETGKPDVVAFQAVTMGKEASEYTAKLFEENKYQEYLYMHGMSVECAEALAEYWHKIVREELDIAGDDAPELKKLFSQGYQGSRFSFGYPACPNLEDQVQLFDLIRPERVGIELTEEFHLVPEQSTTAIVVHHPEAKYFNIR